ncbi:MAG: thrombospondin type 3 repeat-containing protein [Myxococcota bacterium]
MRRLVAGAFTLCAAGLGASGCIEDSDCGICDPDNLLLESISSVNYASRQIHVLNPECEGSDCPSAFNSGSYFTEDIGPCEETEEAIESPRGAEEFCKISPLLTAYGLEFIFNNLLDPTSIELVRKRPDNPQLFEVYDWKHRILEIEGPITRFNGDFYPGSGNDDADVITRLVNLSCIDNLRDEGLTYSHLDEEAGTNPCNQLGPDGRPRKMRMDGTITSYPGRWTVGGEECSTPEDGADTCCSRCDYLLSTQISKYGLKEQAPQDGDIRDLERQPGLFRVPEFAAPDPDDPDADPEPFDPEDYDRDYVLSRQVRGAAIVCDPTGNIYQECADFIPWVGRSEQEIEYTYYWDCDPAADAGCEPQTFRAPYYDQLRETHPDNRPEWLERRNAACVTHSDCRLDTGHNLPGTDCVGADAEGRACYPDADPEGCTNGRCVAEWFVTCLTDTNTIGDVIPGGSNEGFCADQRYYDRGAGACLRTNAQFDALCDEEGNNCQTAPSTTRLAYCDHNEDGTMFASECCQDTLQTVAPEGVEIEDEDDPNMLDPSERFLETNTETCDPAYQDVTPVTRYDRNENLPETTRNCVCPQAGTQLGELDADDDCFNTQRVGCFWADDVREQGDAAQARAERAGQYAVKLVRARGGVIYDPAVKGFEWRSADLGTVPRADIEDCAEDRGLIGRRNIEDGWRANDAFTPDRVEDYDRALCSSSEYTIHFKTPDDGGQYVVDKVGNTLSGKSSYTFQTPQFHIEPGSGFPSDNLRIGACNDFSIRFSNVYDMSPENLSKIQIWQLKTDENDTIPWNEEFDVLVAGGPGCAQTKDELEANAGSVPCLTLNVEARKRLIGEVGVEIDPTEFGPILETGVTYRMWVPGLSSEDEMNDPDAYAAAFWDACGMPLITTNVSDPDFLYDFTIDQPKCKEDQDLDNVQLSCDNAPDFFNPDQGDIDRDGFGDVIDLCPTLAGSTDDSADSDDDGVGNQCDSCRQTPSQYNKDEANPMGYMLVRNIPFQQDADGDGIGDVCDNCIHVANCEDYGPGNEWTLGDPIAYDDNVLCQLDDNDNMVGDACDDREQVGEFAAGPVGLGPDDDFDQDGIGNVRDACPRQPVALTAEELITCENDSECPEGRKCETFDGVCDHLDTDDDGVGDVCDTCPFEANPMQVADGAMQEGDDTDGDFVGNACETNPACEERTDARPFSFYEVSANGYCCTVALFPGEDGDLFVNLPPRDDGVPQQPKKLEDPDGTPVRLTCSEADEMAGNCRALETSVAEAPGIITPPAGCEEALAGVDPRDNRKLTIDDFEGDANALWDTMCFLPQFDQDYDGLGDKCDLCEFDFDPENLPFIDGNGRVWPTDGKFCNGDYSIDNKPACQDDDEPIPTGGTGMETGMDTEGMEGSGSGTGMATTGG